MILGSILLIIAAGLSYSSWKMEISLVMSWATNAEMAFALYVAITCAEALKVMSAFGAGFVGKGHFKLKVALMSYAFTATTLSLLCASFTMVQSISQPNKEHLQVIQMIEKDKQIILDDYEPLIADKKKELEAEKLITFRGTNDYRGKEFNALESDLAALTSEKQEKLKGINERIRLEMAKVSELSLDDPARQVPEIRNAIIVLNKVAKENFTYSEGAFLLSMLLAVAIELGIVAAAQLGGYLIRTHHKRSPQSRPPPRSPPEDVNVNADNPPPSLDSGKGTIEINPDEVEIVDSRTKKPIDLNGSWGDQVGFGRLLKNSRRNRKSSVTRDVDPFQAEEPEIGFSNIADLPVEEDHIN